MARASKPNPRKSSAQNVATTRATTKTTASRDGATGSTGAPNRATTTRASAPKPKRTAAGTAKPVTRVPTDLNRSAGRTGTHDSSHCTQAQGRGSDPTR